LPGGTRVRKIHIKRYEKQVPGHQIQVEVKFLKFDGKDAKPVKRYQYTAIDDATRVRALEIYDRHNQANAIDFIDTVIAFSLFQIREVRTDNGHAFQAKFHWHLEDQGIRHVYVKPASLRGSPTHWPTSSRRLGPTGSTTRFCSGCAMPLPQEPPIAGKF
jgi:transposase-like protein